MEENNELMNENNSDEINKVSQENNEEINAQENEKNETSSESEEMLSSKKKITELENELADYKDRLIRKIAEFDNYKRRTENDQLNLLKYAAEGFIIRLLPVIDDFERSLKHSSEAKDIASVVNGVKMIYEKFMKLLDEQGVKKIDAVGFPFDVHYHEAMLQREAPGVSPHTVLDEIETGYIYKDKVLRHSKVIVSDDSSTEDNIDSNENNNEEGNL
ncbi:MAG TPA: nucleotide exchange factor GrpE [Ignavibacteriaceae bacterium]|nr:nucleotide exchange factor GrpE [Ignavibacteriaceae bacterium]